MNDGLLGRLERVDLRDIWTNEAAGFTPWLAQPENLELLADTLGIELELEVREKKVGLFQADILCKDVDDGSWVVVENQLERTDHKHLGQLLTYAAGLQAVTIVWLAADFTDEHRAALDWLNSITDESFRFFGLKIELWRIGDSLAAPKFNIVAQPNDWSKAVAQEARASGDTELSETQLWQRKYWTALNIQLDDCNGPVKGRAVKRKANYRMSWGVGTRYFRLVASVHRLDGYVRAALEIRGNDADRNRARLEDQKEEIEQELGYPPEWEDTASPTVFRIACHLRDVDPANEPDWDRQHHWLATHLNAMHRVFSSRVKNL